MKSIWLDIKEGRLLLQVSQSFWNLPGPSKRLLTDIFQRPTFSEKNLATIVILANSQAIVVRTSLQNIRISESKEHLFKKRRKATETQGTT